MLVPSWPRAIVHADGDAFFASCEQAVNPALKGKPVVTGKERNIVAAASYEARALGISRGVALWEARKMCPALIVVPSDYETYSLFSKRMFEIMRRYTPAVEEYSVDEAFADLTGLRRLHRGSYGMIAQRMQTDIHRELGITVSVGVSITKTLAKVASKQKKPAGFTVLGGRDVAPVLFALPVENVWNIGPNTAALLKKHGMQTALQFAGAPEERLRTLLTKPGLDVWHELNGRAIFPIETEEKTSYQSLSKVKTFTPPSSNEQYVFAQLVKNVENASLKARRHCLAPKKVIIFLKKQDFRSSGVEATLSRPTAFPIEFLPLVRKLFRSLYTSSARYRATGVVLADLVPASPAQPTLFEDVVRITAVGRLYEAVDVLREKYGKHVVHHGASLAAHKTQHLTVRGDLPARKSQLLKGETKRRRLPIPLVRVRI